MDDFSKSERAELRRLSGEVHDAELKETLKPLDAAFQKWRDGDLPSGELVELIHAFHQGEARNIWSMYQTLKPPQIVARGLARGYLQRAQVAEQLRSKLEMLVGLFKG